MTRLVNLWFALLGLGSSKLRSALTTLGVIIGVGAVIMIVSLGNGLRRSTQMEMESWSSGTIDIRPMGGYGPVMMGGGGMSVVVEGKFAGGGGMEPIYRQPVLSVKDVEALQRLATSVSAVCGEVETYGQVVYRGQSMPMGQIVGVSPNFLQTYDREIKWGRFFNGLDEAAASTVMVIEEGLAEQVFGKGVNPVGEIVHVAKDQITLNFEIIGVTKAKGTVMGWGSQSILIPLRTAQLRLNGGDEDAVNMIAARVESRDSDTRRFALIQMNSILRARRGIAQGSPEDYMINDTLSWSDEQNRILLLMTLILSLIAGISLIVGSIGLMNIMLVGVSERTYEIGLRRAIGARKTDVLGQFLAEAALLSLLGGLIGMGLGIAGSYGVSTAVEQLNGMVTVTPDVVLIALGISAAVGILSGLYPAWRAARLLPSEALRHG